MTTVRGRSEVKRYIAELPTKLKPVLQGAARAGATVIADEAKDRCASDEVKSDIVLKRRRSDGTIGVLITVKPGWTYALGTWLEWGTDPHFISVDDSQGEGRSARRINRLAREGTLVISGAFVGSTVFHPGARPHPFLRPALDTKEREAVTAAQRYIDARVTRAGIAPAADSKGDAE